MRFTHRSRDLATDAIRSFAQRVRVQVRIAGSSGCVSVPEELADQGQAKASTSANARMRVPEIVDTNTFQTGALGYCFPWTL